MFNPSELLNGVFTTDPQEPSVMVADGFGVKIRVSRGHLLVCDGIGSHRRERRLPRAQRTVRRIVLLGHTGYISLEAIRWCVDTGIAILQLDSDGTVLLTAGQTGVDDARLRRAQAAAPSHPVGIEITRWLLAAKMTGQATVAESLLEALRLGAVIRQHVDELAAADSLIDCRRLEANTSNAYFAAWAATVTCRFAERDRHRVPDHWRTFAARTSPLRLGGHSPRVAADPINALLNYGYALAEAESRFAVTAVGLDPGLGIVHTDQKNRDSLALDLLEPLRPLVEEHVLRLLRTRHWRANDFHETRQGACRLLPNLTHELSGQLPLYAREAGRHAETVRHRLTQVAPGRIELRTPLSRDKSRAAQGNKRHGAKGTATTSLVPMPSCRSCGVKLTDRSRQLCPTCWPITRRRLAYERAAAGNAALASLRVNGADPSHSPQAAAKRAAALSKRKQEEHAWCGTDEDAAWTRERYLDEIQPTLAPVPLRVLKLATGLSISACSRIRSGKLVPHHRHWEVLRMASTQQDEPTVADQMDSPPTPPLE